MHTVMNNKPKISKNLDNRPKLCKIYKVNIGYCKLK